MGSELTIVDQPRFEVVELTQVFHFVSCLCCCFVACFGMITICMAILVLLVVFIVVFL